MLQIWSPWPPGQTPGSWSWIWLDLLAHQFFPALQQLGVRGRVAFNSSLFLDKAQLLQCCGLDENSGRGISYVTRQRWGDVFVLAWSALGGPRERVHMVFSFPRAPPWLSILKKNSCPSFQLLQTVLTPVSLQVEHLLEILWRHPFSSCPTWSRENGQALQPCLSSPLSPAMPCPLFSLLATAAPESLPPCLDISKEM